MFSHRTRLLAIAVTLAALSSVSAAVSVMNGTSCEVNMGGIFPMRRNDAGLHREASWHASVDEMNAKFASDSVPIVMKTITKSSSSASANSDPGVGLLSAFAILDEVIGIVGPASSGVAKSVQQVAKLFDVPQISYSATAPSLSDKVNYPTFFRTCPSDAWQGEAMAGLAKEYQFKRIAALSSNDEYGVKGVGAVQTGITKMAPGYNLTLSYTNTFAKGVSDEAAIDVMLKAIKAKFTSVIILFCDSSDAAFVLGRANALGMRENYLWMVSDSAVKQPFPYDDIADFTGMIGVVPKRGGGAEFDAFLPKWQSTYNQAAYIKETGFAPDGDPNNWIMGTDTAPEAYANFGSASINSYAPYAYDAGYAFGVAIRAVYDADGTTPCSATDTTTYRKLLGEALKKVSFDGLTGVVSFDDSLDRVGGYNIVNSQAGAWVDIGVWTQEQGLVLEGVEAKWSNGLVGTANAPQNPTSVTTCFSGSFLAPTADGMGVCVQCTGDTYSAGQNAPECKSCPPGATCTGGMVVNAAANYWQDRPMLPIVEADTYMWNDANIVHPEFFRCNDDSCCIDGGCVVDPSNLSTRTICLGCAYSSATKCDTGREGLVCASCISGYSEWGNTCVDCDTTEPGWVVFVIFMCGLLVAALCIQVKADREHAEGDRIPVVEEDAQASMQQQEPLKGGLIRRLSRRLDKKFKVYYSIVGVLIRMIIEYVQLLGLIVKVSYLESALPWFYLSLSFVISSVSGDEPTCLFNITPIQRAMLGAIVIVIIYAELCCCAAVSYCIQKFVHKVETPNINRYRTGLWRLSFFCFPIFLAYELNLLACVGIHDETVLVLFPGVVCWEGDHLTALLLFGLFCIALVGGLPAWLVYSLNPQRNPEVNHPRMFGMLSAPFKPSCAHWFGVFFFIRRAAAFAVRSAFVENVKLQKSLIGLVVVVYLLIQIVYRPYRRALLNYIQCTFFACVLVCTMFQLGDTNQNRFDDDANNPYTTVKDVMVTIFIFLPVFVIPWLSGQERKSLDGKNAPATKAPVATPQMLDDIGEDEENAPARAVPVYFFSFADEDPATSV